MVFSRSTPAPAYVAWLGYGGLIPFILLAAAVYVFPQYAELLARGLLGYGAVILSFVGALHWGFAMAIPSLSVTQRLHSYQWSVVPALLAWVALSIDSAVWGAALLVLGFLANYWRDVALSRATELPGWYLPLRLRLTAVASLCLVMFAASLLN